MNAQQSNLQQAKLVFKPEISTSVSLTLTKFSSFISVYIMKDFTFIEHLNPKNMAKINFFTAQI